MFTHNLLIEGDYVYGLKLLKGIREFDLILISDKFMEESGLSITKTLLRFLSSSGKIGVQSHMGKSFLVHPFTNLKLAAVQSDKNENYWRIYSQENKSNIQPVTIQRIESLYELLKLNTNRVSSVLAIDIDLQKVAENVFFLNYKDNGNRRFVLIHNNEKNSESLFEFIKKSAFIYQSMLQRIVLDSNAQIA